MGVVVIPYVSPFVHPYLRPERYYHSNSLRISAICLKFGGMMHSTMEQITVQNGHAWPIFACSVKL